MHIYIYMHVYIHIYVYFMTCVYANANSYMCASWRSFPLQQTCMHTFPGTSIKDKQISKSQMNDYIYIHLLEPRALRSISGL